MDFTQMTIKQIDEWSAQGCADTSHVEQLRQDHRVAVRQIVKKIEKAQAEISRVQAMYQYEESYYTQGLNLIAGVDEAGRGPLAGPLVVAAVVLPPKIHIPKINDSKKLSPKVREEIYEFILANAVAIERIFIEPKVIDAVNIYQATLDGMKTVLNALRPMAQAALVDAMPLDGLGIPVQSLIRGDAKSANIAAASIVAKVERDRHMDKMDALYPNYGFAAHKGYGTAAHIDAVQKYGPCLIHRYSFEPIKSWRLKYGNEYDGSDRNNNTDSNKQTHIIDNGKDVFR